jgi:PAS domain S-box-containing protein
METFFLVDPDGAILLTSPSLDTQLGFEQGELDGKDVSTFFSWSFQDWEEAREEIARGLRAQGFWNGAVKARKKDGTLFSAYSQIRPILLSGKSCWMNVLQDLTAGKGGTGS